MAWVLPSGVSSGVGPTFFIVIHTHHSATVPAREEVVRRGAEGGPSARAGMPAIVNSIVMVMMVMMMLMMR